MDEQTTTPLSGRRAQAARNDRQILESARAVFMADPTAPIAAVAEHAGVGISALYRRYAGKDDLLRRLATDGMDRYLQRVEEALADDRDAWRSFARFMRRSVDEGASSLTSRMAGTFIATEELYEQGRRIAAATGRLLERAQQAGVVRPDIDVGDLSLIFEQLQTVQVGDPERSRQLRQRYLALYLDALHRPSDEPLPAGPPRWQEIQARYDT